MATKKTNAVAKLNPEKIDFLVAYGKQAGKSGTGNIVGKLLKFSKGEYLAGQDDEEIAEGTKLAVNLHSLLVGWTRWEEGGVVEQLMGPVMDGFQPQKRSELGFTDKKEWDEDNTGVKRDVWQFGNIVLMKTVKKGNNEVFTFTTSSDGGRKAIGRLCTEAGEHLKETGKNECPVISLGTDFYRHQEYGKVYTPEWEVVGWVPATHFDDVKGAGKDTSDDEDERSARKAIAGPKGGSTKGKGGSAKGKGGSKSTKGRASKNDEELNY